MLNLGNLIKELRIEKGWTQVQLAEAVHTTQNAVSQWENGRRLMDLNMFQEVLEVLGANLNINTMLETANSYRIEPSTYIGEVPDIQATYLTLDARGVKVYEVSVERLGLKLIIPEFTFSSEMDIECEVLGQLAFDYACYESSQTFMDYLSVRNIQNPTEQDKIDFDQLHSDINCVLKLFSEKELSEMECN